MRKLFTFYERKLTVRNSNNYIIITYLSPVSRLFYIEIASRWLVLPIYVCHQPDPESELLYVDFYNVSVPRQCHL